MKREREKRKMMMRERVWDRDKIRRKEIKRIKREGVLHGWEERKR